MPDDKSLKTKVLSSLMWKFLERGGVQIIQFIISVIIARLLSPESYGLIALIIVFINIASVFVRSGLGTALVQKKNADSTDFSSIFFYSIVIAAVLYCLLFFSAPFIAAFYSIPKLTNVLRITALTLFPGALNSIQNAFVSREMKFKKQFYSSMGAVVVSGIVGVLMAYMNYEEWALVYQQLSYQTVVCIIMWFTVKWRPVLKFSYEKSRSLLKYGSRLLAADLVDSLYYSIQNLAIGSKYSAAMLAYFNKGNQFPQILIDNINGSIQSVMLPAFASSQDDKARVKALLRRSVITSTFVSFPVMAGLAATAKPLIVLVLTEKWLPCVPFLQLYCITAAMAPMHTSNSQAINALGKSSLFLKLFTIQRIFGLVLLSIGIFCFDNVIAIAICGPIIGFCATFLFAYPNKKLLNYSFSEQLRDIYPAFVISVVMFIAVVLISFIHLPNAVTLVLQTALGITIYVGASKVFKIECLSYISHTIKDFINR